MADFSPDFNLKDIIKDLPAARFLWYNLVSEENEERYLTILGELLQLFITPHEYSYYPYREASYLKKYEKLTANYESISSREKDLFYNLLAIILELESPYVDLYHSNRFTILFESMKVSEGEQFFNDAVLTWYFNSLKPVFILPFNIYKTNDDEPHRVMLALKKLPVLQGNWVPRPLIKMIYFNPHGFQINYSLKENVFINKLKLKIQGAFSARLPTLQVVQLNIDCSETQTSEQGSNCVQHTALLFSLLLMNPSAFDNIDSILHQISRHATLNITLFSLSMFLRTMPHVTLKRYYYFFLAGNSQKSSLIENIELNTAMSSFFQGVNCPEFYGPFCDRSFCSECNNVCRFKSGIEEVQVPQPASFEEAKQGSSGDEESSISGEEEIYNLYECKVLDPKQIAAKMFRLYFELKDMTVGIEPRKLSFMLEQMEAQLNFPTPGSNKDYYNIGMSKVVDSALEKAYMKEAMSFKYK